MPQGQHKWKQPNQASNTELSTSKATLWICFIHKINSELLSVYLIVDDLFSSIIDFNNPAVETPPTMTKAIIWSVLSSPSLAGLLTLLEIPKRAKSATITNAICPAFYWVIALFANHSIIANTRSQTTPNEAIISRPSFTRTSKLLLPI